LCSTPYLVCQRIHLDICLHQKEPHRWCNGWCARIGSDRSWVRAQVGSIQR
jgi:hypothetical protein